MDAAEAEALLRKVGGADDDAIDVAHAALAFATLERPQAGNARYKEHLGALAEDVKIEAQLRGGSLSARIDSLRSVLVDAHGYRGDRETYDDLRNADLAAVIDRRLGLPVALSILWLHTARAQGWTIYGLNVPAHFLVRIELGRERAILDPFNEGRVMDAAALRQLLKSGGGDTVPNPDDYTALSNRRVLLRLQNNIKLRLLKAGSNEQALTVIERMKLIAPSDPHLWREAGLVQAALENLNAAIANLDTARGLAKDRDVLQRIEAEISALRGKLN